MRYALAAVIAIVAQPVLAQTTNCSTFGTTQTCRGPNGYSSTESQFGDMSTGRDSLSNSWTTSCFGDQTRTQFIPFRQRGF